MLGPCPNCKQQVDIRFNDRFELAGDVWRCIKCPTVICVACYPQHTAGKHPEVYQAAYFDKKAKKKK